MSDENVEWVFETTLAGPDWFNDAELARVVCASGDLESRDSRYPSSANKGIK